VNERVRVLVADDHPPTRFDVRREIERDPRFEVCAEVADAPAAIEAATRTRPHLGLLDIHMPGGGIAATWEITARLPTTKIVMLTVSRDDADLFAALRAGASGYLLKDMDLERLVPELENVLLGEAAIPPNLVARLVDEFRDRGPRRRATIETPGPRPTSREWQVLDLLRQGLSTAEMAKRLYLSRATVRTHIASILKKLRVPDRDSAVRLLEQLEHEDSARLLGEH
jgi:DNA-binding NarL/FixJ family response regulator